MIKHLFLLLSLLLTFSAIIPAEAVELPRSGQATSYAAGDDGDMRAGAPWPEPRFSDSRNGTISDDLTGLSWSSDANLIASRSPDIAAATHGSVTWQSALDYVTRLNVDNYLGYSDWRLPNLNELATILNQGEPGITTWLGQQGVSNLQPSFYWTSSSVAINAVHAWGINFSTGSIAPNSKSSVAHIWPVRGGESISADMLPLPRTGQSVCYNTIGKKISCTGTGQDGELRKGIEWPTPRFSENNDGTVTDDLTGLVWVKNANLIAMRDPSFGSSPDGRVLWPDALEFVSRLNRDVYLGYTDWRLPNRNELVSIINYAESNPTDWINTQGFSDAQQHYWSSGTSAITPSNAWNVFLAGDVSERNKHDSANGSFVWPVRGGVDNSLVKAPSTTEKNASLQSSSTNALQAAAATLAVSTSSFPAGTVGLAYSQTLAATGGTTPYTWTKTTGSLPAGLTLSTAGVISGTPTTAATSTFTVQVKDKVNATATKSLSITVSVVPLSITTTTVADGYLTTAYSQTLTATGGKSPYTWSRTSGTLPAGLTLTASTGKISGTPTATGTGSFTVQVKDANNAIVSKPLTITVFALPSITTASLPAGSVGTAYNQLLTVIGGKTAYTWSITSGTLPAGLTLNVLTGVISGTPTTSVTSSSITFKVTDANNKAATKALSIIVNAIPLTIGTSTLADAYITRTYSQTVAAIGGKAPYAWSISSGILPSGLALNPSTGVINGTLTTNVAVSSFTVQVTDANSAVATKSLTIYTLSLPLILTNWLPSTYAGSTYNLALQLLGGKAPYVCTVVSGTLPAGLSLSSSGIISGTPAGSGTFNFIVQLADASNVTATRSLTLEVYAPIVVSPATLNDGYIGTTYAQTLSATGGQPPYTWSISNGTLPTGFTLAVNGSNAALATIRGTSASAGAFTFTVQIKDGNNTTSSKSFTLNITDFGTIGGTVTDLSTGAPLQGVTVTLNLTGITSNNSDDRLYACNSVPLTSPDYLLAASNDGSRFACSAPAATGQSMSFKVRNPFGAADPFSIKWTGTSALADDEYLAQSFKPTRNGQLSKVMFEVVGSGEWGANAWVYVQLKTSLNGGAETLLAETPIQLVGYNGISIREFTFPVPVVITAGQQYFLVLKGQYHYNNGVPPQQYLNFMGGTAQINSATYIRNGGIWSQESRTLVFQTFIDGQPDVTGPSEGPDPYMYMVGDTEQQVALSVLNHTTGLWEYGGTLIDSSDGDVANGGDYFSFSKGDSSLTIERTMNGSMSNYYDQNGWVTARVENLAARNSSQLIDQFSLTYNRTLTATTDANGAYSFSLLPDGNYTLTFGKTGYFTGTASGTLAPGQTINSGAIIVHAPVITTTNPLPAGMIGSPYTQTISVTDGLPPYTWSITSGSLPPGLTLTTAGNITGTPTSLGNSSFTVQVKDNNDSTATKPFIMAITGSGSIGGSVSDQATGAPLAGVNVTLALTGITGKDPADRVYSCNNSALTIADYNTVAANDDAKFSCLSDGISNTMLFKVRNPSGADFFSVSWNGMLNTNFENLAQSFKPVGSGSLTKASFYLPHGISSAYYAPLGGEVHLQLKTGLGGDAGTQLAESISIPIETLQLDTPQWVEFVFPAPVSVVAGQEYYLEIQGRIQRGDYGTWYQYQPEKVSWGDGMSFAVGSAYSKQAGVWSVLDHSLAFRTYINNDPDITLEPATNNESTDMYGIFEEFVRMSVYNQTSETWETGGDVAGNFGYLVHDSQTGGGYSYRGDDLTIDWSVSSGLDRYYDQNGWLTVRMDSYANYWAVTPPLTSLVTDQFKLTFNRTLTAVTDANGAYSFPSLPDGNYTVVFDKSVYTTEIVNGSLQQGQSITINPKLTTNTALRIFTNTLAVGSAGADYSHAMVVGGGRAPYRWSILAGALPSGLKLDSNTGVISGKPAIAGDSIFTVKVQDANNQTAARTFTLKTTQIAVPARISISPSGIPFGVTNIGKIQSDVVTVTNTGPAGLAIGQISQPAEPFRITIDNCSNKTLAAAAACTITVQFSPPQTGSFYDTVDIPSSDETYPTVTVFLSGAGFISYLLPDTGRGEIVKNPLTFVVSSDNTAIDSNTRLMWQRNGSQAAMDWPEAGDYCRNLALDGYNDWRLPSFLELTTVINYGTANPSIDSSVFPGTRPDNYWTAFEGTGKISNNPEQYAGVVNFAYGEAHPQEKTTGAYVRCTRGQAITGALRTSGDAGAAHPYTNGLISTDQSTGLIWAGNPAVSGFDPAICDYAGVCFALSVFDDCGLLWYAGKSDWRKPTIKELATLSSYPCFEDSCRKMSATPSGKTDANGNLSQFYLFAPGIDIISVPPNAIHAVSCVRGGSSFDVINIGDSGNVSVMEIAGDLAMASQKREAITREYIRTHGDSYDFLVYLSTFDYSLPDGAQGLYTGVKHDTYGINQSVFDYSARYGSQGKLQGTIELGNVSALAADPHGPRLDQTLTLLGHELNHRWGSFVGLGMGLLGEGNSHWSYLLDSKGSLMYGNGWKDNGNGTFTSTSIQSGYSPLDLYLMGMIPKEQVPPMLLIDNPAIDKTQLPHLGDTITGTARTVTIDDIVASEGERVPNAATAQKQFNVGFVLLTRPGDNTAAATQAIETLRKAWAGRFAELTQGKAGVGNIPASLEIVLDSPADGAIITGPDVTVSGTVINTSGVETGVMVNGMPTTVSGNRFIANHVPLQLGSNTLTVTATDANGLTTTTSKGVTAQAGNYLRISASAESGVAPVGIAFSLNAPFVIVNPQISTLGPIPVTIKPGAVPSEFSTIIAVEGTYAFSASANGPDGQTYSDTITIVVNSKGKIDSLLRTKWSSVNSLLTSGNTPAALRFFTTYSRDKYQAIFNEVSAIFPNIAATYRDFTTQYIGDGVAHYKLTTNQNGAIYAYEIVFEQEENGLWLLRSY